jgi:glycosyltransferase involved in cell wall biosynthesis
MRIKHVVIVTHYFACHPGGIEFVVDELARAYVELGLEVSVVALGPGVDGAPYRCIEIPGWNVLERFGVPVPIVEPWTANRKMSKEFDSADLVHIHGLLFPLSLLAMREARRKQVPVLVTEHVGSTSYDSKAISLVQKLALANSLRVARRSAQVVTVLNDRVSRELTPRMSPVGVKKISNGVDGKKFHPATASEREALCRKWNLDGPTILVVARNVARKGLGSAIAAAEYSRAFSVLLVGRGTEEIDDKTGVSRSLGSVSREVVAELYRACDALLLASEGEGVPLVAQEALASGLPVILGDDADVSRELPNTGVWLTPRDNPEAIAKAVADALVAGKASGFSSLVREEVLRHSSWDEVAGRYLEIMGVSGT